MPGEIWTPEKLAKAGIDVAMFGQRDRMVIYLRGSKHSEYQRISESVYAFVRRVYAEATHIAKERREPTLKVCCWSDGVEGDGLPYARLPNRVMGETPDRGLAYLRLLWEKAYAEQGIYADRALARDILDDMKRANIAIAAARKERDR